MKKLTKFIIIIFLSLCIFSAFAPITAYAYDDYYIVNATSGKFHLTTCSYLPEYGNRYTVSRAEIDDYPKLSPCKHCDPLNNLVYEPENPGQSSGGSSSLSSNNKKDTQQTKTFWQSLISFISDSFRVFILFLLIIIILLSGYSIFQFINGEYHLYGFLDVLVHISLWGLLLSSIYLFGFLNSIFKNGFSTLDIIITSIFAISLPGPIIYFFKHEL